MRAKAILLVCIIYLFLSACAQVDSRQSFDTQADFTALKTYD